MFICTLFSRKQMFYILLPLIVFTLTPCMSWGFTPQPQSQDDETLITRARCAQQLYESMVKRLKSEPSNSSDIHFNDVKSTHPAWKAIVYFQKLGVILGLPDGTYHPDATINRYEFAVLLNRLVGKLEAHQSSVKPLSSSLCQDMNDILPDVPNAHWALEAALNMVSKGIMLKIEGEFRGKQLVRYKELNETIKRLEVKFPLNNAH